MKRLCLLGTASALSFFAVSNHALAQSDDLTIKLGGRLHIEYTLADLDGPDDTIDATEIRRARLKAHGNVNSQTKYKLEFNHTSGGGIDIEDAYVSYALPDSRWRVKIGHFKTQNSLEEAASSNTLHTIERAAFTDAWELNRRVGVEIQNKGKNYIVQVGAFTTNANADGGIDEGRAFAARGAFNPIKTKDTVVHLGASWRYREIGGTEQDIRLRQRPFTHVTSERIIETPRFIDNDSFYGFELAAIHKGFWAAGEYAVLDANGSTGNPDATFDAFSAEVGYIVGGKQPYKDGVFKRTKVNKSLGEGGYGAVSFVARFDRIDQNDNGIIGGELDTYVAGVNWWMSNNTRLALNYFNLDAENGSREGGQGLVTRLQLDF